jgi:hypothetical protein
VVAAVDDGDGDGDAVAVEPVVVELGAGGTTGGTYAVAFWKVTPVSLT